MRGKKNQKSNSVTYKGFFHLPRALLNDRDFIASSAKAVKLLIDIGEQYNGRNNGDLCASITLMEKRGWKSREQLSKAKKELLERNLIEQTRQGGLNMGPSLYAITWQPIDECGGKLHVNSTTTPSRKLNRQ